MLSDFFLFFSLFIISLLLTRLMIAYARHKRLVDVPNERSSHAVPTPRGGGLAIVIVFLIGFTVFYFQKGFSLNIGLALVGSGLIAAAVGFLDDHRHISVQSRILVHFLAAGWALYWLGGFPSMAEGMTFGRCVQNLFWLVALVWFLNAYNFMDGIDGIAGVEAVFVSGAAGFFLFLCDAGNLARIFFVLLVAAAGFLYWNLSKARIFMGDVGSGFLGIIFGVLANIWIQQSELNIWVWMILLGVFVSDTTITVLRRILRGASWYTAHRSHAYQYAAQKFKSHGKVTIAVTCINLLWLFPLAFAAYHWPVFAIYLTLCAYMPLVWLVFRFQAGLDN